MTREQRLAIRNAVAAKLREIDRIQSLAMQYASEFDLFGSHDPIPTAVEPTEQVKASTHRTETIVLWEGAEHTPLNTRIARSRTALLESQGNFQDALKSLREGGHKISQSAFYGHIKKLDTLNPGWNQGMISKQVGNLENGVSPRYNGKQAVPNS